jgi:multidrug efflux pump subunit AcrA (membrane-fusion protein)
MTSIGTVIAPRSITLRNELPGTVRQIALTPGQVVDAGTLLVALDVSVEEAELRAQEAQAALAETTRSTTSTRSLWRSRQAEQFLVRVESRCHVDLRRLSYRGAAPD